MEQLVKTASIGKGKNQGKKRKVLIHSIHENRMGFLSWKYCYFRALVECNTESMFLTKKKGNSNMGFLKFLQIKRNGSVLPCLHAFFKNLCSFLVQSNLPDLANATVGSGRLCNLDVSLKCGLSNIIFLGAFTGLLLAVICFWASMICISLVPAWIPIFWDRSSNRQKSKIKRKKGKYSYILVLDT